MNPTYSDPKLVRRVYDLRTQGEAYHSISSTIQTEFNVKITDPTIKVIYERFVAKNMIVKAAKEGKLAEEIVPDFQRKMETRLERISQVTDDLMDTLDELKKKMPPELYVKFIPTILMVCREILNQCSFIRKEQSQVLVNQKNLIYSPLQIMNIVNTEIIKLEKEGKIEIKDSAKKGVVGRQGEDGRILSNEEREHLILSKIRTSEEIENQ